MTCLTRGSAARAAASTLRKQVELALEPATIGGSASV